MSWRLRRARREDAAGLAGFAERTFRDTFEMDNTPADMDAYCAGAFGAGIQGAEIASPEIETVLAFDRDGRLAGYLQTAPAAAPQGVASKSARELRRLYVDAQVKGAGLAGVLMGRALEAARADGADCLWLGVWERNARAIAFYEKHGFRVVGEHDFLLGADRQRDLLMARELETDAGPGSLASESVDVGGVERAALVRPAPARGAPLVLVFHGRGGTAQGAAAALALHRHMAEALVVYPQGVAGQRAMRDPEGTRPSWQRLPGELEDRDLRFFDALLAALAQRHDFDRDRVYLLGQSNGGRFANLVWSRRGEAIAALCSAGSQGGRLIAEAPPRSVCMVIGEKDRVAPRAGQEKSIPLARARLGIDPESAVVDGPLRRENGPGGLELAVYLHAGGHEFPRAALPVAAAFFRRHANPGPGA